MSKKPLGKDKFGVQKVMRVKDYFGDATGQFACLLYTSDAADE